MQDRNQIEIKEAVQKQTLKEYMTKVMKLMYTHAYKRRNLYLTE